MRRAVTAALIAGLILTGCASTGSNAPAASGQSSNSDALPAASSSAERTVIQSRTRMAPGQVGLEVLTWQVSTDSERFNDALRSHAAPAVAAVDEIALRRNGFILWAVKVDELDALRNSFGGSPLEMRTWLGTATAWREVVNVPIGNAMVEVDGVARERMGTQARLMARTWPVTMEDGLRISIELVPQLAMGAAQTSLIRNANQLSGDVVRSCAMGLELQRGTAWILTCDPGGFVETDAEAPARARDAATVAGPPSPNAAAASGKIGARVLTLGAATLLAAPERQGAAARRTVLVMIPHLPDSAFPVEDAAKPMEPSQP